MSKISNKIKNIDDNYLTELENVAYENNICIELNRDNEVYSFNTKKNNYIWRKHKKSI